jgi:hypothetical protein
MILASSVPVRYQKFVEQVVGCRMRVVGCRVHSQFVSVVIFQLTPIHLIILNRTLHKHHEHQD